MRSTHYLKTRKRKGLPALVIFFDTETKRIEKEDRFVHKLRLGYYEFWERRGKKWRKLNSNFFFKKEEFWGYLLEAIDYAHRRRKALYIFAHNLMFDAQVIDLMKFIRLYQTEEDKSESKRKHDKFIKDSQRYIVYTHVRGAMCKFLSTTNFFKQSLQSLAKMINMEKVAIEDFDIVDEETLKERCKIDVEILREFMFKFFQFLDEHNWRFFTTTAASLSFSIFRAEFLKEKEILIHDDEDVLNLEIESYRGGRTEVFFRGRKENVYYLDVNSMYPYVMRDSYFPIRLIYKKIGIEWDGEKFLEFWKRWKLLKKGNYVYILRGIVRTDEPCLGVKYNDRLIFPVGEFEGSFTSAEIDLLLSEGGEIVKVFDFAIYEAKQIFKEYVEKLYDLRLKFKKEKNKVYEKFIKLLLNSLYGKFGERRYEFVEVENEDEIKFIKSLAKDKYNDVVQVYGKFHRYYMIINGRVYRRSMRKRLSENSFPAIASFVTSYARNLLWKYIKTAGRENVFYCDTDSLFTNKEGYENVKKDIDQRELGKLKLEGIYDAVEFINLKHYIIYKGEKKNVKLKGINLKRAKQISENEFETTQFLTEKSKMKKYADEEGVIERKITKRLRDEYLKGFVTENGWVEPYMFNDIEDFRAKIPAQLSEIKYREIYEEYMRERWKEKEELWNSDLIDSEAYIDSEIGEEASMREFWRNIRNNILEEW